MRLGRIMLGVTALVWLGYGAWLFVDPKGLSYTGFDFPHWSVTVEVVAMYGAFELALGGFALLACLRPRELLRPALLLWALLYSALVIGRVYGILAWDGTFAVTPGGEPASYNAGALFFLELPSAILFWLSLYLSRPAPATPSPA